MAERVGRGLPGEDSALLARARGLPASVWVVLLVALSLVAAVIVSIVGHDSHPVDGQIEGGFSTGNPRSFTASYEVTKSPLATSVCDVQAEDQYQAVVGSVTDVVGPTGHNQKKTIRMLTIPTTGQAVTAVIGSCRLVHAS